MSGLASTIGPVREGLYLVSRKIDINSPYEVVVGLRNLFESIAWDEYELTKDDAIYFESVLARLKYKMEEGVVDARPSNR